MKIFRIDSLKLKKKSYFQKLKRGFNSSGVIIIENVISRRKCSRLKLLLEHYHKKYGSLIYGQKKALKHSGLSGAKVVTNLHNKDARFLEFLDKKNILKIAELLLQQGSYMNNDPIICQAFTARSPTKGSDSQQIHNDSRMIGSKYPIVVQAMYVLDNFTKKNGATNFLLGSQNNLSFPKSNYKYRNLVIAQAKAGSVILFNGSTWHGSSKPQGFSGDRWAIICRYSRWFIKPTFNFIQNTPLKIFKKMNKKQRDLLGFRYYPPLDEFTSNRSIQKKHTVPKGYKLPK